MTVCKRNTLLWQDLCFAFLFRKLALGVQFSYIYDWQEIIARSYFTRVVLQKTFDKYSQCIYYLHNKRVFSAYHFQLLKQTEHMRCRYNWEPSARPKTILEKYLWFMFSNKMLEHDSLFYHDSSKIIFSWKARLFVIWDLLTQLWVKCEMLKRMVWKS